MNRDRYRLVFSTALGMLVPAGEHARARGKRATRRRRAASGICLLALVGLAHAGPPAPNALPQPRERAAFVTRGALNPAAPLGVAGSTMTINQATPKVVLNWNSFNIGRQAAVVFNQPSATAAALNRIHDSDPSVIEGRLTANGQVYLINRNGILFDRGAQVNVGTLIASALDITDEVFDQGYLSITDGRPAFSFDGDAELFGRSFVRVGAGASIKTAEQGQVLLFAPRVSNAGSIETPAGQTLLAAGAKVYLAASGDPRLRGLLVEVDPYKGVDPNGAEVKRGGEVTNERLGDAVGEIIAERGNITLVGLAVNQNGQARATTTVNANGSIYLLARQDTITQVQADQITTSRIPTASGTATLGAGSLTEVVPDLASTETSVDQQTFYPSQVRVAGADILLDAGALIRAPSGEIALAARQTPSSDEFPTQKTDSRIYIAPGARIDAAGTQTAELPMERNVVTAGLFGNELRDAPLQRGGILRRQNVKIDVRKPLPEVADVSGYVAQVQRGIGERSAGGGQVEFSSDGDIVLRQGAEVDVSGGSVRYRDGFVETTTLIAGGRAFDISSASPDRLYDSYLNSRRFETAYSEGKDAGTVSLVGRELAVDATLKGAVTSGGRQRTDPPKAGRLIVGNGAVFGSSLPDYIVREAMLARGFGTIDPAFDRAPLSAALGERGDVARVSTQPFESGGFGSLGIYANDKISVGAEIDLDLPARAEVTLAAKDVATAGDIRAAGGKVTIDARRTLGSEATVVPALQVGAGAVFDLKGQWVNELPGAGAAKEEAPIVIGGGSIALASEGTLEAEPGAVFDVSGGGWLQRSGGRDTLRAGDAGSIRMQIREVEVLTDTPSLPVLNPLRANAELRGYALGEAGGGSLSIAASSVRIGGTPSAAELGLDGGFFQRGGFANYSVAGPLALTVEDGTALAPRRQSFLLSTAYKTRASGSSLADFAALSVLPAEQREPTDLALSAGNLTFGRLSIGSGAAIDTDIGAKVSLSAGRQLTVAGSVLAPAGEIRLVMLGQPNLGGDSRADPTGYLADQSIWLASSASLAAPGAAKVSTDNLGRRSGELLDGGRIEIEAGKGYVIAQEGARLDVRGVSEQFDLAQANGATARTELAGAAGAITVKAREGVFLDASMDARSGGPGAAHGSFVLRLDRDGVFAPLPPGGGAPYPSAEREVVVTRDAGVVPMGLAAGQPIPSRYEGKAPVSARRLAQAQFDSVELTSDSRLALEGGSALTARRELALNAPVLAVAARGEGAAAASVGAPYVSLGNRNRIPAYQALRAPSAGAGELFASADLIDLEGNFALQSIGRAAFASSGDIRFKGIVERDSAQARGALSAAGPLVFSAAQLYPTTLSEFEVAVAAGADSRIRIEGNGTSAAVPLSAAGALTIKADAIEQSGTLRAPQGTIRLEARETLELAPGSETSVAAADLLIPFGRVENQLRWLYDYAPGQTRAFEAPPDKSIVLSGRSVEVAAGARVDLRGGGDLYAYEFVEGLGGSTDVLGRPGTFAVIPGFAPTFAPHDHQYAGGVDLRPGDRITLAAGAGLRAGTYTLLPGRYALLPGAYAVTALSGFQDLLPGSTIARRDGSAIVAGYRTVAATGTRAARSEGWLVEPGPTIRARAEYLDNTANSFFARLPVQAGRPAPRLPADAGRLALAAIADLDLLGRILFDAGAGHRGGQLDISAPRIAVGDSATNAPSGFLPLQAQLLSDSGADSILLGGTRGATDENGQALRVDAMQVRVDGASPLRAGEVILAAREEVRIGAGAGIEAAGAAGAAPAYTVRGDGALVRVGSGEQAAVTRSAVGGAGGVVAVGEGARLRGDALLLDATRDSAVAGSAQLQTNALALASSRLSLGAAPMGNNGLVVGPTLLNQIAGASALEFKSYSTVDFYGSLTLGGETGVPTLNSLRFDAPALVGHGAAQETVRARAANIELVNTGAVAAPPGDGAGQIVLEARGRPGSAPSGTLRLGEGAKTVSGFSAVTLAADGVVVVGGEGKLDSSGALRLEGQALVGEPGAKQRIAAAGPVEVVRAPQALPATAPGLGASVEISGSRINQAGTIDLPAGVLSLSATGAGVVLEAGSVTRTTGLAKVFQPASANETTVYADAGTVRLIAEPAGGARGAHDVEIRGGARVDVSAAPGGGDAGTLELTATEGRVVVAGEIAGAAPAAGRGGRLRVDADELDSFSALNEKAGAGRFDGELDVRVRTGDIAIAAADTVRSRTVRIAADSGALSVGGTIDSSGSDGGRIGLYARDVVTVQGAELLARAGASDGAGGHIEIGASAGEIDLQPGSVVDVSGAAPERNGEVLLRARQTGNDVAVARLEAQVRGARQVAVEGVRTYGGVESIVAGATGGAALGIDAVAADAEQFMLNADVIATRLGKAADPLFKLRAGVEIQNTGDMRLATPWDLSALRPGGEPGTLTLRATGNLRLADSLSDGFSGTAPEAPLADGASWSFRLVGGADPAAADPLRVVRPSEPNGAGDVTLASNTLVRSGTGDIEVAAGRDFRLADASAALYTAGRPAQTLPGFFDSLAGNFVEGGGDVRIVAQRDAIGAANPYLVSNWLWRQGDEVDPTTGQYFFYQPAWWPRFDKFRQNIGALGGGDVSVVAEGDVRDLSVMIPTNARVTGTSPRPESLVELGGGDLQVEAGGDIRGGQFMAMRGTAKLRAGGSLTAGASWDGFAPALDPLLVLGSASADVQAKGSIAIASVLDPGLLPLSQENFVVIFSPPYFSTYGPQTAVRLSALGGDIALRNNRNEIEAATQSFDEPLNVGDPGNVLQTGLAYPPSLRLAALNGDIGVDGGFVMYPAARGSLDLLAQGSVTFGGSVLMADLDAARLASPIAPRGALSSRADVAFFAGRPFAPDAHAVPPVHAGDHEPVRIYAETGSIVGLTDYSGVFPKQTRVIAGRDIVDFHLASQNVAAGDLTEVSAGRDIVFNETRNPNDKSLIPNNRGIEVGGPGTLEVRAGRDLELGNSVGIVTKGNLGNPGLAERGADIVMIVGAQPRLATQEFVDSYLSPAKSNYLPELAEFVRKLRGDASITDTQALGEFPRLAQRDQVAFATEVIRSEFAAAYLRPSGAQRGAQSYLDQWLAYLRERGGDPNQPTARRIEDFSRQVFWSELIAAGWAGGPSGATPGNYRRGFEAIRLLGYSDPLLSEGSLNLSLSQIKTERGGGIDLYVPGGFINGGAVSAPSGLNKNPDQLGMITGRGGDIRAFVRDDLLVNRSRIFTLEGGSIIAWSSRGDIDAGRGARTAISAPPPIIRVDPVSGQFIVEYPGAATGSGIGVLLTRPGLAVGDVILIAPSGEINAGDAGIRASGNITLAAQRVVGADVIQAGGTISGAPAATAPAAPAPPPPSPVANDAAGSDQATQNVGGDKQRARNSILTVEVVGLGDGSAAGESPRSDSAPEEEEERRRRSR